MEEVRAIKYFEKRTFNSIFRLKKKCSRFLIFVSRRVYLTPSRYGALLEGGQVLRGKFIRRNQKRKKKLRTIILTQQVVIYVLAADTAAVECDDGGGGNGGQLLN